jgi:hypothetical protein
VQLREPPLELARAGCLGRLLRLSLPLWPEQQRALRGLCVIRWAFAARDREIAGSDRNGPHPLELVERVRELTDPRVERRLLVAAPLTGVAWDPGEETIRERDARDTVVQRGADKLDALGDRRLGGSLVRALCLSRAGQQRLDRHLQVCSFGGQLTRDLVELLTRGEVEVDRDLRCRLLVSPTSPASRD